MSRDMVSYYRRSWAVVSQDLVSWVIFYAAFLGVALLTCGLGGILYPNVMRETASVARNGGSPRISAIFHTEDLTNDFINYACYYGGMLVGGMAGGVGSLIAAALLQFQIPMAAEDRYAPTDNARLSMQHVIDHPSEHIVFLLLSYALTLPAIFLCMLPMPLIGPVLVMAHWLWYDDVRSELDALAEQKGVPLLDTSP